MGEQKVKTETIKVSADKNWILYKREDRYGIIDNRGPEMKQLFTPGGASFQTSYLELAKRIYHDVITFGPQHMGPESILPWHYTMCEHFAHMEHEDIEHMLDSCFLQKSDWTFETVSDNDEWVKLFGEQESRTDEIRQWLSECTHMQMNGACCIGNAYHSLNVAYVLAAMMENYQGKNLQEQFELLAKLIEENSMYGPAIAAIKDFETFRLYYGIHLKEEGPTVHKAEIGINNLGTGNAADDIGLLGEKIDNEIFVGRNYYHYTDGVIDAEQPMTVSTEDVELYNEEYEDEVEEADSCTDSLAELLPDFCWIKRISVAKEDQTENHLIVVETNDDSCVCNISEFVERVHMIGNGMFMIPDMDLVADRSYERVRHLSDYARKELTLLMKKRVLPLNFSFIGSKLPQDMIDQGGNGGSKENYTYALQSAYRLAYMDMSVDTSEDGVIKGFSYSTYQSTGSGYWDMFSRPQAIDDRNDEAVDMLLYLVDMYSDEEYKKEIKN